MSEVPMASRVGDSIKHSAKFLGAFEGLLLGIALGIFIICTFGAGAALVVVLFVVSVACIAAVATSELCELIGSKIPVSDQGNIVVGASTVFIGEGSPQAANVNSQVLCKEHGEGKVVAQGSQTVSIERKPASRCEDKTSCDGEIEQGCETVGIGGPTGTYVPIEDEVPRWFTVVRKTIDYVGMVCGIASGIGAAESLVAALRNWRLDGQILSLALGASQDVLNATGHTDAARRVGYAKSTVDLAVAGGDLSHALSHVPEGAPRVEGPEVEAPTGEAPTPPILPREPQEVPRALEPASSVPVAVDGAKRVWGDPPPPALLPLHA
jgi:uncharacterized Zn-binding protein involved in type VI secretion